MMGSIKDRNGMDLTEAEDIKKRWQEYTEELYKKDLHDQHFQAASPSELGNGQSWRCNSLHSATFVGFLAL